MYKGSKRKHPRIMVHKKVRGCSNFTTKLHHRPRAAKVLTHYHDDDWTIEIRKVAARERKTYIEEERE